LRITEHFVESGGWFIHLKQSWAPEHLDRTLRPLVIIPGYGMNSFIFGFHPQGTSMARCLAEAGFEVWSVNMRGQGPSRPMNGRVIEPSLEAYATVDLVNAIEFILAETACETNRVDLIGASLGGSVVYAYLALHHEQNKVGSVVTIGGPLRWVVVHPMLKVAFASPAIAGMVRFPYTQMLARHAFPLLSRIPGVLSLYMNAKHLDLSHAQDLTKTVDNLHGSINRDLAFWMQNTDLVVAGVNITEALVKVRHPLMVILGNKDGIVPPETALAALDAWGGEDKTSINVGTPDDWYAHADLFVGNEAPQRVFTPIADWLLARQTYRA